MTEQVNHYVKGLVSVFADAIANGEIRDVEIAQDGEKLLCYQAHGFEMAARTLLAGKTEGEVSQIFLRALKSELDTRDDIAVIEHGAVGSYSQVYAYSKK